LCLAAFAVYLYVAVGQLLTADQDHVLGVQAHQIVATYDFPEPHRGGDAVGQGSTFTVVLPLFTLSVNRP
jgi:hypothetical protein